MHVRVAERRHRQLPAQLDHAGARTGDLPDLLIRADRLDQAAAHGQGLDEPGRVRRGAYPPASKNQVGPAVAGCHGPLRGARYASAGISTKTGIVRVVFFWYSA